MNHHCHLQDFHYLPFLIFLQIAESEQLLTPCHRHLNRLFLFLMAFCQLMLENEDYRDHLGTKKIVTCKIKIRLTMEHKYHIQNLKIM